MIEWALVLGNALNDPSPVEIATYESEEKCRKIMFLMMAKQAEAEGKENAMLADIYVGCEMRKTRE
jgi:hypothetical protein